MRYAYYTAIKAAVILILMIMLFIGCGGDSVSFNTDSLREVTMTKAVDKNLKPVGATDVFTTKTSIIYCSFELIEASPGIAVTAEWIYVDKQKGTNYLIEAWTEISEGPGYMSMFIRRPPKGWPRGDYMVVLYIDNRKELSVPFKIK